MKNKNRELKRCLSIAYFILLCLSLTQKFLYVDYGKSSKNFYFFNLTIVLLTFIFALFYLKTEIYTDRHKNNKFALITLVTYIIFAVYIYSHFVFFDSLYGESIVNIGVVHFRLGFYLYWVSFIILFINTFLVELPYEKKLTKSEKMIKKPIDVSNQYLLCYYENGLGKEFSSLKGNFSVLVIKEHTKKIDYSISNESNIRNKILEEKIVSIEVREKSEGLPDYLKEEEKISAVAFLFRNFGAFIASDKLSKTIDEYGSKKVSNAYEIRINYYNDKKILSEIVFLAKTEPFEMLKNINCEKCVL